MGRQSHFYNAMSAAKRRERTPIITPDDESSGLSDPPSDENDPEWRENEQGKLESSDNYSDDSDHHRSAQLL